MELDHRLVIGFLISLGGGLITLGGWIRTRASRKDLSEAKEQLYKSYRAEIKNKVEREPFEDIKRRMDRLENVLLQPREQKGG